MKPIFTDEFKIVALEQLDQGASVPQVAVALGTSESALYRWCARAEAGKLGDFRFKSFVLKRNRKFTDEEKIAAAKRVEAGERPVDIARELGTDYGVVRGWYERYKGEGLSRRVGEEEAKQGIKKLRATEAKEERSRAEAERKKEEELREKQKRVKAMVADPLVWMQQHTETRDSHWRENGASSPYRAFPDYPYLRTVVDGLLREPYVFIEKSRDMMISWLCVGYFTHAAMTVPGIDVAFQTQKEDKAFELVSYAKTLYERQKPELQEAFPLEKSLKGMADGELLFANGSRIIGIPGGADQIRSYHPSGLLMDEAAFMPEAGDSYNNALPVSKKIVVVSSAGPGWFADTVRDVV